MEESDLTIVIPTLANELSSRALKFCLESLEDFKGKIIIAVNGSNPWSNLDPEEINSWSKDRQVDILVFEKQGQCNAVNGAARSVTTPWMMVMNDDQIAPPGWFKEFMYWVENFGLLVASPNLVEPRKGAPPFIEHFCGGVGTVGVDPDFKKQCFLDFVSGYKEHENKPDLMLEDGFNLPFLIRKDVWDTIGGYDEAYDPWGSNSDSDLQYKIMVAGITPKRIRSTIFYHFSNTSGTFHPSHQDYWQKNFNYFTEKWGFQRANSPEIWYKPTLPEEMKYKPDWKDKFKGGV